MNTHIQSYIVEKFFHHNIRRMMQGLWLQGVWFNLYSPSPISLVFLLLIALPLLLRFSSASFNRLISSWYSLRRASLGSSLIRGLFLIFLALLAYLEGGEGGRGGRKRQGEREREMINILHFEPNTWIVHSNLNNSIITNSQVVIGCITNQISTKSNNNVITSTKRNHQRIITAYTLNKLQL